MKHAPHTACKQPAPIMQGHANLWFVLFSLHVGYDQRSRCSVGRCMVGQVLGGQLHGGQVHVMPDANAAYFESS